jgi:hypothetical protein
MVEAMTSTHYTLVITIIAITDAMYKCSSELSPSRGSKTPAKKKRTKNAASQASKKSKVKSGARKKKVPKKTKNSRLDLSSLGQTNPLHDAAANAGSAGQPVFSTTTKHSAFQEMFNSLTPEVRKASRGDCTILNEASKVWGTARVKIGGDGKMKLKG